TYPEAHCNLGHALQRQGRLAEAAAEFRRGHELGRQRPDWKYRSADWVRDAEQLAALDARLPAVLAGEVKPPPAEAVRYADLRRRPRVPQAAPGLAPSRAGGPRPGRRARPAGAGEAAGRGARGVAEALGRRGRAGPQGGPLSQPRPGTRSTRRRVRLRKTGPAL